MRFNMPLTIVLALAATPLYAAQIDFSQGRIVATFAEYNLTTNMIAQNGKLLIPDSQTDVLMVRDLAGGASYDIPLSVQRANFITATEGNKVAISDPSFDKITVLDVSTRREVANYTYTNHFGPWHMTYLNGVIYGSNMFDQLINRYNTTTRRALSDYPGGSGPTFLAASHNHLFVLQQGGVSIPGDDYITWFDVTTGRQGDRELLDGAVNEMTAWNDGVCITIGYTNKIQCGQPETKEWLEADTEIEPWGITTGHGQIWVLTRGEDDVQPPMVITYGVQDGKLVRLAAWKLRGLPNLDLPRNLAYDAQTDTLLVRGSRSVYAFPVID